MSEELRRTEAAVLANFRKENPSTHFLAESRAAFEARRRQRECLFRDNLKFPPKMFEGCRLLDLGAGTGENSVYYAHWGATCTLVEINDTALARARQIFDDYLGAADHDFVCASLFDYRATERFDIVLSEGVVHHTADKAGAFAHLVSFLKPGGYAVLGVGNAAGCFQRALQRVILFTFAADDEAIVAVAERLFKEHIDRAAQYGQRTRRAVIFDSFVNPKVDFPSVSEVLGWFAANGLALYSSWPPLAPALLGDSGMRASFDPLTQPAVGAVAEAVWLTHDRDDRDELAERLSSLDAFDHVQTALTAAVNDFGRGQDFDQDRFAGHLAAYRTALKDFDPYAGFTAKTTALLDEVDAVLALLAKRDLDGLTQTLAKTKHLFRGTGGLGVARYIGYKPEQA